MNEPHHTDGPWHSLETEKWRTWGPNQPSSVCHVGDYTIITESPSYEFHGSDADDARLIAAAPEMLQALLAWRKADAANMLDITEWDRLRTEAFRLRVIAIAKAVATESPSSESKPHDSSVE